MIVCWKCGHPLASKILFRTACDACSSDQHVCINCRNYCPGKPNDCLVPNTEYVRDREAANFCEDFSLKQAKPSNAADPNAASRRLFGEDLPKKKNPLLDD